MTNDKVYVLLKHQHLTEIMANNGYNLNNHYYCSQLPHVALSMGPSTKMARITQ